MNYIKYISVIVLIFIIRAGYSQSINIYFKTDSFAVTQSSTAQLIDFLNRNQDSNNKYRFEIIGRTDSEGNPEYNKQLSFKRANSTKSFLVSNGIDTTNLILTGYGEYKPIANNNNEEGKAQNRCVTVNITKWSERLSHLLDDSLKVEEFDFHTKNGYTKKLNDCCSITFKPFALADSLGKEINGNIKLRVTYYNNAIDMIKSNITMQAKIGSMDIAYKSHLMFTIEAFYNKKPLKTVYENYVSLDCGCAEMLKNSSVFSFNDGKWDVIQKPKKEVKPIEETKTGNGSKKSEVKVQIEDEMKIDKPITTPPIVNATPGGAGGGGKLNLCDSPSPCSCVDYLAGDTRWATFAKDEWHVNVGDKRIRWGFPNIYPNHLDSIIDFNTRYNDFNFCRKGYVPDNMIETIDFSIKISIQEKGFFKKKKYLKIKSTDLSGFPELIPIKKQIWKIQKETFPYSDKEFKKMKFHDFRVIKEGKDFVIELKSKDEFIKMKVNADEKEIEEPYSRYQSELEKLGKRVSDSLSKRLQNLDENYLKHWCEIKHCYNIIFPELEKDMPLQVWRKYIYENKDKFYSTLIGLYNQKALAKLKFCEFDTTVCIVPPKRPGKGIGLGTLNVDEVIEIKDTLQQVKYYLENGQEAYVKQAYVFNKTNRTIVNVENPNQFRCNFNDKSNIILLLDYKDRQFLLNENKAIVTKNNITHIKLIESPGSLELFKKIVESSK